MYKRLPYMTLSAPTGMVSVDYLQTSVYTLVTSTAGAAWRSPQPGQILHPR